MKTKRKLALALVYMRRVPKQALLSYHHGAVVQTIASVVSQGYKARQATAALDHFHTGATCSVDISVCRKVAYEVLLHELVKRGFSKLPGRIANFSKFAGIGTAESVRFFATAAADLFKRAQKQARPPKKQMRRRKKR